MTHADRLQVDDGEVVARLRQLAHAGCAGSCRSARTHRSRRSRHRGCSSLSVLPAVGPHERTGDRGRRLARQHVPRQRQLLAARGQRDVAVVLRTVQRAPLPPCGPPFSVHVGSLLPLISSVTRNSVCPSGPTLHGSGSDHGHRARSWHRRRSGSCARCCSCGVELVKFSHPAPS